MKSDYTITRISKQVAASLLLKYHYLKDLSKGFKGDLNFGLYKKGELVGVCIFTTIPVPELAVGCFGLARDAQDGFYELSRPVLHPDIQKEEHNLASWFVARSIKLLRLWVNVKALLSYADCDYHNGTVYQAVGFKYYGMTATKKDFFMEMDDGTYMKIACGKVKGVKGVWRPRSRKHRYLMVFDKTLSPKWKQQPFPKNRSPI